MCRVYGISESPSPLRSNQASSLRRPIFGQAAALTAASDMDQSIALARHRIETLDRASAAPE